MFDHPLKEVKNTVSRLDSEYNDFSEKSSPLQLANIISQKKDIKSIYFHYQSLLMNHHYNQRVDFLSDWALTKFASGFPLVAL